MSIPESHSDIIKDEARAVLTTINQNSGILSAFCTIRKVEDDLFIESIDEIQREHIITNNKVSVLSIDPNNADWLVGLASILVWSEKPQEAIDLIKQAMSLNPMYPPLYLWHLGHAYLTIDRYDEAIATLKRALTLNPNFWPSHILLAASYSMLGRMEEARAEAKETLRLNPDFTLESWRLKCPFKNQTALKRRLNVLRKAGFK